MAFTHKDWKDKPDPSTPLSAANLEDLEDRLYAARLEGLPLNVTHSDYGADPTGVADSTNAINDALGDVNPGEKGIVYIPPGTYKITDPLTVKEGVALVGAGSYATVINCASADSKVYFDQSVGGGRGPLSGGFRINMAETATTGMQLDLCVNRSFDDIRIDSPAANGTALLLNDAQNCCFTGIDLEAKGGGEGPAGTRGLVFDMGASGNNFYGFRCNEFMGPHVSYRMTAAAWSGVDMPRHNWLWGVMIERTTTSTAGNNKPCLIYHRAGDNNGICGGNISGTTDDADPATEYALVEMNNSGDTGPGAKTCTRPIFRDLKFNGEIWSGTRRAIGFDCNGTFFYGLVEGCTVGNVRYMMRLTSESSHCMREQNNFVDELVTSRYTGSSAYMRANFTSTTGGTITPRRGQVRYFYAGGAADLTTVNPSAVETGFVATLEFYASRTVKHGTGNIYLAGTADFSATANDILRLVYDGAGGWHECGRTVK